MGQTRLLIADEDPIFRLDLLEVLQDLGYQIAGEAADAQSALAAARAVRPDLVIMDIHLAGTLDGLSAAAALTGERIAPVVLLIRFGDGDLVRRAEASAVVGCLVKPIAEEELRPAIEVTLARFQEFRARGNSAPDGTTD